MKYFLHDSNAFNDEKITELYLRFGYEGLGLFYTLLEKLASQEKPMKTIVLKAQLKVGKKLEKCWSFMEEIQLISSNNGDTFNKQLLNFSEKYNIKKEKNTKRISEWRKNQELKENVTCYESVSNTSKVKESKVKESKKNIYIPEFSEFKEYAIQNQFNTNLHKLDLKYKSWVASGWVDGNGKKIINWKSKLLNSLEYMQDASIRNPNEKQAPKLSI